MKTVLNMLSEKLNTLGYNETIVNSVISKLDIALVENVAMGDNNLEKYFVVQVYEEPNVELNRTFLNVSNDMIQCEVIEGDIHAEAADSAVSTRIIVANYTLSKRCAIIGITNDFKIKIIVYNPTSRNQMLYSGMTYEQVYKKLRDEVAMSYYEAFWNNVSRSGKTSDKKIKEIITLLTSDLVIDEIAINDLNPKFKMYDNEYKYAENINSYAVRYINLRTNRVEFIEKDVGIKMISKNVQPGIISNDPYIRIDKKLPEVDFPLNSVSYYWIGESKGVQEQIAIFIPSQTYEKQMFSELKKEDLRIDNLARDIAKRFTREVGFEVDSDDVKNILSNLNFELMCPSVDFIRNNMSSKSDPMEPIRYKYKIITDPAEFESELYITIEDHMARRYKYKLVENIGEDLTTIGNKLEYTNEKGEVVRKQSVADFNVNKIAAVISRETFIGADGIPDLLGYIYEDMPYLGTDALPVPNIEILFYVPLPGSNKDSILMYNGTSLEYKLANITNQKFYDTDPNSYVIGGGTILPGSTTVTVRYVNSYDEILKENTIANVFPNDSYLPDIIPVINDKEGKEWVVENNNIMPLVLTNEQEKNIIEIRYIQKYSRVRFSFINRDGKQIIEDKQELVQVGTNYDFSTKSICLDGAGEEWKLINLRPSKLVVSEFEERNKVILVYDIEKEEVIITCVNKEGIEIIPEKRLQAPVDKVYKADVSKYLVDASGLGWGYIETSNPTIKVVKGTENKITLMYGAAKQKITIKLVDALENRLVNDEVVFEQIGKTYSVEFEKSIIDLECKEWKLLKTIQQKIKVDIDETKNVIEAMYEPALANVSILFVNESGMQIRDGMSSQIQIGARVTAGSLEEIQDNFGKTWTCVDKGKSLIVSKNDNENRISLVYKPLIGKLKIIYFDSESKELIPPKFVELQVGTSYKNAPMQKITDEQGKKWIIDESKIPTVIVKKFDEENIVSIYYDKELTKVSISFFDAYGNVLKETQEYDAQIGEIYDTKLLGKITDSEGYKWMLETTEPKNLKIRETGNSFKFIYGEVKAKVLVRCVNVETQKSIIEDAIYTVKLGGIYVPNIASSILDKNKWKWKYIGDNNISIITKENEQENIIVLNYEELKGNVILKFKNKNGDTIRPDAVKSVQVGKEIRIEHIEKFNDNNGLGWKFVNTTLEAQTVKEEENIIEDTYEPLMAKVITRYLSDEGNEVTKVNEEKIQVGMKYTAKILERLYDSSKALWLFKEVNSNEIIVKDEDNVLVCKYDKALADVTINFLGEDDKKIIESKVEKYQIGTVYKHSIQKGIEDAEGKAWIYDKINIDMLEVNEDSEKNIINVKYKKELVSVKLCFYNTALQVIKEPEMVKVQIGSVYIAKSQEIIVDKDSLGWIVREDLIPKLKVKRNPAENIVNINYDKYLVDTFTEFIDDDENKIKEHIVTKCQVGTKFMPKVENYIEDAEGREWISAEEVENKVFTLSKKIEAITVSQNVEKNIVKIKYKPSLVNVKIKYVDPMGTEIKKMLIVRAQIGSVYNAEIIESIISGNSIKWSYNANSKSSIKVSKDEKNNVISLAYEEQKSAIFYKYYDEDHNLINDGKRDLAQIGSKYRVVIDNVIEGKDGRFWEYKAKNYDEIIVDEDEKKNVIDIIYAPLNVDVVLKFVTLNGNSIMKDKLTKAQLGSDFKAPAELTITDDESRLYKFVSASPNVIKVKEVPIGKDAASINSFELTYESVYVETRIVFKDVDGNKIKEDEIKQMHVGSMFEPKPIQYVTDRKGIQWEIIDEKIDSIRVMEDTRLNIINMTYEIAKAEVFIRYKDMDGNIIKEGTTKKLEIGSEFVPKVEKEIEDQEKKKWIYCMTDPVKLTVGSINNNINIIYQEKKANTTVIIQSTDGRILKPEIYSKQQIGSKYSPAPATKVLYDNSNNIWRFAFNSPSDIIVSENQDENVIIQYFIIDDGVDRQEEVKPKLQVEERFIDKELIAQVEKEEAEKKQKEEEARKLAEMQKEEAIEFEDEGLRRLDRSIKLTNPQKVAIQKLNEYNTKIMTILREAANFGGDLDDYGLRNKLDEVIRSEKEYVTTGLADLIAEDRTGNKILKIFEAITSSEMGDTNFNMLQQKKAILFADFFVSKNVAEIEEITYICARGKNDKQIECVDEKIKNTKNNLELKMLKIHLIYESVMLDNYYRARSIAKDEYFKNASSRDKISREIIVGVTNSLPNQAIRLFEKCVSLSLAKRNELDAIMKLLNEQQLSTVRSAINNFSDGKTRKIALKLYKEIVG